MPQERRQREQARSRIEPGAIPAEKCADGKGVPEVMGPRRRGPGRYLEAQPGDQAVKHLTDRAGVQAATPAEGEQRSLGRRGPPSLPLCLQVLAQEVRDPGAEGDE